MDAPEIVSDARHAVVPPIGLILGTVGRSEELVRFLRSLASQENDPGYDLIIVDQNESAGIVRDALAQARLTRGFVHIRCARVSLSYARNVGLPFLRSQVVGFPDDDCEYPAALLARVSEHHRGAARQVAGLCCRFSGDRITPGTTRVLPTSSLGRLISFSFFLYADHLPRDLPRFDERFGIGAYFGACEESEFLLRAVPRELHLDVAQDVVVRHPIKDLESESRARSYGRGFGALARILVQERDALSLRIAAKLMLGSAARAAAALARLRGREARVHLAGLRGRLEGFFRFRRADPSSRPR